jgi:hypothetical protein
MNFSKEKINFYNKIDSTLEKRNLIVFFSKWQKFRVKNTKHPMKPSRFCEIIPNSTSVRCAIEKSWPPITPSITR